MTEQQFEKIFKEHYSYMCNVAYSVVLDEDDAYDIAQLVFTKLWDKRNTVNINDNIKAYLHRATLNTSFNFIEKHKRTILAGDDVIVTISSNNTTLEKEFSEEEIHEAVKKAISELSEKTRIVFSLSRYSGLTNKEIAEDLDISVKAVEKHITKALKELRVKLKKYTNSFIILLMTGLSCIKLFL